MLSCSAAKQPIERNAGPWNSERCTWKIKPPSTTCSCPSAATIPRSGSPTSTRLPRSTERRSRSRTACSACASSIASPAPSRTIRRWARSTSPTTCARSCAGAGQRRTPRLVGLSLEEKDRLEADLPGAFEFSSDRNFADYLYLTKTIAAYEGPGLAKKRRETNKFFQLYGSEASFEPIALDHMDELRAYQQVWFETSRRRGTDEHPLELEHRKILLDMNHFEELDLEGILLRIGGTVEGYAYGSVLPGGAFDVMVLKGNLDFRFVWRALLRELARYCVDKATYLNLEEDLGLPGLRENKLSYQPCALMEKYQGRLL
ncbi:MAG: DUF2156 domain-containing protein [Eggerthella lenta]